MTFTAFAVSLCLCRQENTTVTKMLRVMKISVFIILIACLQVSAKGIAQDRVTFSGKDVSLEKVFAAIKKQTTYSFFYFDSQLQRAKKVTLNVNNATIEEVLTICFRNQPLNYTINEKTIFIVNKQESNKIV